MFNRNRVSQNKAQIVCGRGSCVVLYLIIFLMQGKQLLVKLCFMITFIFNFSDGEITFLLIQSLE